MLSETCWECHWVFSRKAMDGERLILQLSHVNMRTDDLKFRWHVLTGLGVFYYITFIEYLRLTLDTNIQRDGQIDLIWPGIFSLPHLEVNRGKRKRQL